MSRKLFTVGYEGIDIDNFISHLKDNAIDCLLDVRELPLSRKKGFSKTALSERLNQENIYYIHFKELGSPKPIREKLKENHNYLSFFNKMDKYLTSKMGTVENAYYYVRKNTCCLMCFERLAATCHRKIVARKIKKLDGNGLLIKNI